MDVTVCTGGACSESGAELLLQACSALASTNDEIDVKPAFCSGECPAKFAMLCPKKGALEAYEAKCGSLDEAIASAEDALAAADVKVEPGLKEAFIAQVEAKEAEARGDFEAALNGYSAVLAQVPARLLQPCQEPLPAEPTLWPGSRWSESLFNSDLVLSDSPEEGAFGSCGGGQALVEKKVVVLPQASLGECKIEGLTLTGRFEDTSGSTGTFSLTMSDNGRSFAGQLARADQSAPVQWSGLRKGAPTRGPRRPPSRAQVPPSHAQWLHDCLLGRSRCHAKLGDNLAAVGDARAAVELCCRATNGWSALVDALEACHDEAGAQDARAELVYLKSRP